jgi:hypothetical protein
MALSRHATPGGFPVRWVLLLIAVAVVALLVWTNTAPGSYRLAQSASRRTWVVEVGQPCPMQLYGASAVTLGGPVTFPAGELRAHDLFRCEQGTHSVHAPLLAEWVNERGVSNNQFEEISVHRNLDGSVTVTCFAQGGRPAGTT